jgi:uncharacterized protein YdhG (YjbR/CyaY superfamily)
MKASGGRFETADEYIASFSPDVQAILKELRKAIRDAAPGAEEAISYGMSAFRLNGKLVYFAAFKNHIGFYPTASGVSRFRKELSGYEVSKGTVRFPVGELIPLGLVRKIVMYRIKENLEKGRISRR